MLKWTDEKDKIKDVFDNIRNFLICGSVLYAGIFILKLPTSNSINKWQNIIYGIALIFSTIYLLLVNARHATHVIIGDTSKEKSLKKRVFISLFFTAYILLSIPLVLSVGSKGSVKKQITSTDEQIENQLKDNHSIYADPRSAGR